MQHGWSGWGLGLVVTAQLVQLLSELIDQRAVSGLDRVGILLLKRVTSARTEWFFRLREASYAAENDQQQEPEKLGDIFCVAV